MENNLELIGTAAGIVATLSGIYFAYKKMVQAAADKASEAHNNYREAELKDQQDFRNQLMEMTKDMRRTIADQSERITLLQKEVAEARQAQKRAEQHFADCEREIAELKQGLGK